MQARRLVPTLVVLALVTVATSFAHAAERWQSFLSPGELKTLIDADRSVVVVDVRSPAEYAKGHIPGAINLPGTQWRTPDAKPGTGDSQYIFRDPQGRPDVARYEALLSAVGLTRDDRVVIYGNHAGKADGSVPAMILRWLGQRQVAFLDGIGLEQWQSAGFEVSTEPTVRPPAQYVAAPSAEPLVWNLAQVIDNLSRPGVVFVDNRSPREFSGEDLRNNRRGGHIPGAVHLDYEALLDPKTRRILPIQDVRRLVEQRRIRPADTVVLYCQTATRSSLPYLALRDLGFENVAIYDASWHEYGNRDDTPVERIDFGAAASAAGIAK